MQPWIRTFTGKDLNPLEMTEDDICIEDIAHSLALCNRFAGHTRKPISVAQHSVYVARLCDHYNNHLITQKHIALQGLMHDGSEAFLGDVTKWLKQSPSFKEYRRAEDKLQKLIFRKFDLDEELHQTVEWADRIMVRFEGIRGLGRDFVIDHPHYPKLTREEIKAVGNWGFWSWQTSEQLFLDHFRMFSED